MTLCFLDVEPDTVIYYSHLFPGAKVPNGNFRSEEGILGGGGVGGGRKS